MLFLPRHRNRAVGMSLVLQTTFSLYLLMREKVMQECPIITANRTLSPTTVHTYVAILQHYVQEKVAIIARFYRAWRGVGLFTLRKTEVNCTKNG